MIWPFVETVGFMRSKIMSDLLILNRNGRSRPRMTERTLRFEQQAIGWLAQNGRPKKMTRRNNGMLVGQYSNVPIWLFQQAAIATVVLAVMTAACGAPSASRDTAGTREIVRARGQLDGHMAECTKRYGYEPEAASKFGSMSLGRVSGNGGDASIRESKST